MSQSGRQPLLTKPNTTMAEHFGVQGSAMVVSVSPWLYS